MASPMGKFTSLRFSIQTTTVVVLPRRTPSYIYQSFANKYHCNSAVHRT